VNNVVDGSIPINNLFSQLIDCMNLYNIRSDTFYELNGLNIRIHTNMNLFNV
jgi:hypothetical protein